MKLKNPNRWFWLTLKFKQLLRKGASASVITTTRCPMDCDYCPMYIYGDVKKYPESTIEQWETFLTRITANIWISTLYISGGEPTLYKDIVPLINWCVERGHHVIIFTNLWKVEKYEGVKPHYRLLFMPTFHAAEEERLRKSTQKYLDSVRWLRDKGFQVASQQIFQNDYSLTRIKEFFTEDWFKNEDNNLQFPPDAPTSLQAYVGCVNMYRKDETK